MLSNIMWRTQDLLHSKSATAFPSLLLTVAGVCVFYRHMTEQDHERDTLKTFLILIMLQMVPLIALEVKLFAVNDPAGLLCKFGGKVLLMHVCFLALRTCNGTLVDAESFDWMHPAGLIACCLALHFGFNHRWTLQSLIENRDAYCMVGIAIASAIVTEQLDKYFRPSWFNNLTALMLGTAADYTEIVAFVPAVWMAYRMPKDAPAQAVDKAIARTRAVYFFPFILGWYFIEDLMSAFTIYSFSPLGAAGHVLHFILLLDFAGFVLAHLYDPAKLKADLLSWFPDGCAV